ncbi:MULTISPECIES: hypothetical protein [Acidithiobacillaceae]|uniref:Uncharacterized protein n=1 Tax=Igneacidithiobacillus copahuensis TaxID=2724909 RepID=A0AAE2YNF3_9PROT|nr:MULTISPECIES: hypothetical protein [Acidithiobacillaceae]MBU2771161.1 hypothetical protein [Acidithiobacillus caldus]MBU2787048.1 hypothetical protein [Igneacidithiobacillus copahuensis]MBU2796349.1 hypothetical protein [Acidithiobacillus sp. VAN18-2]
MNRRDKAVLDEAVRWAGWVLDRTDMPKKKVFRRASLRFGVPAAAVERALITARGPDYLSERSERMLAKYRPQYAANACVSARSLRPFDQHWRGL